MKRFPFTSSGHRVLLRTFAAIASLVLIQSSFAGPDDLVTSEASDATANAAKNLARMNCGAQIECTTPNGRVSSVATSGDGNQAAAALIMDDDTLSCPLPEGQTTFVIKLPNAALLDRFSFVNENAAAAGKLNISVSNYKLPANSPKWIAVDGSINFSQKRLFNLSMLGVEARYVRLSFEVVKAGRIASLGLYGGETLERFALHQQQTDRQIAWLSNSNGHQSKPLEDQLNFNFANVYAKARVVSVSSGALPTAARMIDDDTETGFRFAKSDPHPTVIVELAESERLHRVSALYKMDKGGRLDVYLLEDISKSATDLSYRKPVASVTDENGDGKAAVDFDPEGTRYVALRWTPASGSVGNHVVEIAEINAFGDVPLATFLADGAPDLYASSSSVTRSGQSGPEFGTRGGALPVLPEVSP